MFAVAGSTRLSRTVCLLVLVVAAATVGVLLALHDGTASDRAATMGAAIAVLAATTSGRRCAGGGRRPLASGR